MEIITTLIESTDSTAVYGIMPLVGAALAGRKRRKAKAKIVKKKITRAKNQAKYKAARKAYKKRGATKTTRSTRSTKAKGGY